MSGQANAKSRRQGTNPASVATQPVGNLRDEVATQLFVKLFDPSRGRKAAYIAVVAIEAADDFVKAIHR